MEVISFLSLVWIIAILLPLVWFSFVYDVNIVKTAIIVNKKFKILCKNSFTLEFYLLGRCRDYIICTKTIKTTSYG